MKFYGKNTKGVSFLVNLLDHYLHFTKKELRYGFFGKSVSVVGFKQGFVKCVSFVNDLLRISLETRANLHSYVNYFAFIQWARFFDGFSKVEMN